MRFLQLLLVIGIVRAVIPPTNQSTYPRTLYKADLACFCLPAQLQLNLYGYLCTPIWHLLIRRHATRLRKRQVR